MSFSIESTIYIAWQMVKKEMQVSYINRCRMRVIIALRAISRVASQLNADGIDVVSCTSPFPSKGVISRWRTIRYARRHQSDINHITGEYILRRLAPIRAVQWLLSMTAVGFTSCQD